MKRTTIMLPAELRARAMRYSRTAGISLGELVRESLSATLSKDIGKSNTADALFCDAAVYNGNAPADLAARHDRYLYDS